MGVVRGAGYAGGLLGSRMYVVVRAGVYDQGVVYAGADINAAKQAAEKAAGKERDFYHDFEIRQQSEVGGEFDKVIAVFTTNLPRARATVRKWESK